MKDQHGREINYIRLSITDRCNLRCQYCMPATGIDLKKHEQILRYEEFLRIVTVATELGIRKVRVTGGEPLVRKGVIGFLEQLSAIQGIEEVVLTTNGLLLADMAQALKDAGVQRLNVSLDSLQAKTFAEITRGGSLDRVLAGLKAAEAAGLEIKLNMVVMSGINDQEVLPFAALSLDKAWSVRFIEYMPIIREAGWRNLIVSGVDILAQLQEEYSLQSLSNGRYCGPAKQFQIAGGRGTVGIITPVSEHFCGSCNRIRVTATGLAKSCLFSDDSVALSPFLQQSSDEALRGVLQQVISGKPPHQQSGTRPFSMASIGG